MIRELVIATNGPGLYECTRQVGEVVSTAGVTEGLCTLFIRHTSASLVIQENADPDVRRDLEAFFQRMVPPGDAIYTHTCEGPDDMPAHVRSALTQTSLGIPILNGRLGLGQWQGVFVWEHRAVPHQRRVLVHIA